MMIILTDSAKMHFKKFIGRDTGFQGIRIGVKGTGCSGLTYTVEPATGPEKEDIVSSQDGLDIYVDPHSLEYIKDLQIDFAKQGFESKLEFSNPQEKSRCGCGHSFSI